MTSYVSGYRRIWMIVSLIRAWSCVKGGVIHCLLFLWERLRGCRLSATANGSRVSSFAVATSVSVWRKSHKIFIATFAVTAAERSQG